MCLETTDNKSTFLLSLSCFSSSMIGVIQQPPSFICFIIQIVKYGGNIQWVIQNYCIPTTFCAEELQQANEDRYLQTLIMFTSQGPQIEEALFIFLISNIIVVTSTVSCTYMTYMALIWVTNSYCFQCLQSFWHLKNTYRFPWPAAISKLNRCSSQTSSMPVFSIFCSQPIHSSYNSYLQHN